jgi:tRNA 2-thiouridine synthesizing protein A
MTLTPDRILDATGLLCPEPVMMLHNVIRDMAPGDVVQVVATDPSTQRDVPNFCRFLGHELLRQEESDGLYRYWLRKSGDA